MTIESQRVHAEVLAPEGALESLFRLVSKQKRGLGIRVKGVDDVLVRFALCCHPLPGERMLCTHDFFMMDKDGDLYFMGRSDDIIKTRGEKVSPVEVENVLHRIAGVREAAVVGVPDELLGEAIRAFIVLDEGVSLTEQQVKRECMARLESFMVPRDVVFVHELPKTATAKVSRRLLRAIDISLLEKNPPAALVTEART